MESSGYNRLLRNDGSGAFTEDTMPIIGGTVEESGGFGRGASSLYSLGYAWLPFDTNALALGDLDGDGSA